jgi:hypothetical protein
MEEKTRYWDTNLSISSLLPEDKANVDSFFCGEDKLDLFFHNEIYMCAKHHYVSAYCAKNKLPGDGRHGFQKTYIAINHIPISMEYSKLYEMSEMARYHTYEYTREDSKKGSPAKPCV